MSVRYVEGNLPYPFYHGVFRLVQILLYWGFVIMGGVTKRDWGGGQVKFYPYKKGGQNKLSHAEVFGQNTFLGSFFC